MGERHGTWTLNLSKFEIRRMWQTPMKKSCIGIKTLFFRSLALIQLSLYEESLSSHCSMRTMVTRLAVAPSIPLRVGTTTIFISICRIVLYNQYAGSHHNHNLLIKKKKRLFKFETLNHFFSCSKNDFCAICNHAWIGYCFLDKAFVYWAEFPNPTTTHWPQRFLWPDLTNAHTHTQASCSSQALTTHT